MRKNVLTNKVIYCIVSKCVKDTGYNKLGRLAQLGEHLPYKQGVIGSSPITPTKLVKKYARKNHEMQNAWSDDNDRSMQQFVFPKAGMRRGICKHKAK